MAMLGATCSPCCSPCPCPAGQSLPTVIEVSFSKFPATVFDRLLGVEFDSCFGSGASATVSAPLGKDTNGFPITSVTLTSGGSGYATLGREQPTITLGNANTETAEVSFSYTKSSDKCGRPLWAISGATVISGGDGYTNAEPATFALAAGTKGSGAVGTIYTQRIQPVLEASAPSGSGVTFTVNVEETGANPPTWRVESVTFKGQGFGYVDGEMLSFGGGGVATIDAASATIQVNYSQPVVEVVPFGAYGAGASLSVTLSANGGDPPTWSVASASIDDAGTGYAAGEFFAVARTDPFGIFDIYLIVTDVGENGEITAVTVEEYQQLPSNSEIESVNVLSGGEYYAGNQILDSIEITNGGEYYGENPSLAPLVAEVNVTITQKAPSNGSGASVIANVESSTASSQFGQVTSLSLKNGGNGYLGGEPSSVKCGLEGLNGKTYPIKKSSQCSYVECLDGFLVAVEYRGSSIAPKISVAKLPRFPDLDTPPQCKITLFASDENLPFGCDPLSFTATDDLYGAVVSVETPGEESVIPDCQLLADATSVSVKIEASDYENNFLHSTISTGGSYQRGGSFIPLSKYAGEFELLRVPGPYQNASTKAAFIYNYAEAECGQAPYLFVTLSQFNNVYSLAYGLANQICYIASVFDVPEEPDDPPPDIIQKGDYDCTKVSSLDGLELPAWVRNHGFFTPGSFSDCVCNPRSLPDLFGQVLAQSVSSDGVFVDRGPFGTDADAERNARKIRFTITSVD